MSVIFAVPRHEYASYRDLYTLIDLSDFQTCFIDEIDQSSDNAYIITIYNGEFGDYSNARARIILLDLEYHLGENALPPLPNVELWASDKWYAEQIGAKYTPLGSHEGLKHTDHRNAIEASAAWAPGGDVYDVAYIGFIQGCHRREVIRRELTARGVRVSPMVGWAGERYHILSTSRVYLHVHQHEHIPTIAPLRMVVAAAYKLPVISEEVADAAIFSGFVAPLIEYRYETLAERTQLMIQNKVVLLQHMGETLHQFLCHDYPFRKSVEAGLS